MNPNETQVKIDWPILKPGDWQAYEGRLQRVVRVRAMGTTFEGRVLVAVIGRSGAGWQCTRVFARDTDEDCPADFEQAVDNVLATAES